MGARYNVLEGFLLNMKIFLLDESLGGEVYVCVVLMHCGLSGMEE